MILVLFLPKGYNKQKIILIKFLYFSVAIFAYLCDKYKKFDWYPTGLKERARVHEYANWQHANLRMTGSMLFRTKVKLDFSNL
jgi:glutathione S-transferase